MLRILVASSKGGCGKTTVATNLAAYYAVNGRNTALVDADRQGSSQRWCAKRAGMATPVLPVSGLRRDYGRQIPDDAQCVVIDTAAGIRAGEVAEHLDAVDAIVVPVLPSSIDLEATAPFLAELAALPAIKRGKVPVGLVANRLKPWTRATQQALDDMRGFGFPVTSHVRDTQGYVLAAALGKGIFDYHSELVRSHQDDWSRLLRWLRKVAAKPV